MFKREHLIPSVKEFVCLFTGDPLKPEKVLHDLGYMPIGIYIGREIKHLLIVHHKDNYLKISIYIVCHLVIRQSDLYTNKMDVLISLA